MFYCQHALADDNLHIQLRQTTLDYFLSTITHSLCTVSVHILKTAKWLNFFDNVHVMQQQQHQFNDLFSRTT